MSLPGTYGSILEIIGSTPVVELRRLRRDGEGAVFAKLALLNPGGSVKDRMAPAMVQQAERDGTLHRGSARARAWLR